MGNNILVSVKNLKKYYVISKKIFSKDTKYLRAVDGISFSINEGEIVGLVGESGSGKSTTGRIIAKLIEPTDGVIFFEDKNIRNLSDSQLINLRRNIQMIFQDPYSSLNPKMTVAKIIAEPLNVHNIGDNLFKKKRVLELLDIVGLLPECLNKYPHEFSGGQRQRIGIARALAINPKFIICDEPVSSLDVSIRAQILNLLKDLKEKFNLTYLFISHDLSVIEYISDRVIVMYLGKIVEIASNEEIYNNPLHPYTKTLLSSIPIPDPRMRKKKKELLLKDNFSKNIDIVEGCIFKERCYYAKKLCKEIEPELKEYGNNSCHFVACHFIK